VRVIPVCEHETGGSFEVHNVQIRGGRLLGHLTVVGRAIGRRCAPTPPPAAGQGGAMASLRSASAKNLV